MSDEKKYCLICGKELTGRQKKYCSKKCMGLSKQGYKICVVCGKKFKDSKSNQNSCCSQKMKKTKVRKNFWLNPKKEDNTGGNTQDD